MRVILNIIWLVLAGIWMALLYVLAGVICCILIITIPFGIASFRIALFALWPFGRTVIRRPGAGVASGIGNVIWLLLEHPAEHERLREDPSLLRSVIEESLRMEPPITAIPRIALEDIVVRDRLIGAGEIVQLSIAAANRDPSRFPDPDRFDAARNPHGVLSFGHGPHGCLGARLANEQVMIALEALFSRLGTELRLDRPGEVRWYRNAGNRGPEALPVTFASPAG